MHDVDASTHARRASQLFVRVPPPGRAPHCIVRVFLHDERSDRQVLEGQRARPASFRRDVSEPNRCAELELELLVRVRVTDEVVRFGFAPTFSSLRVGFLRARTPRRDEPRPATERPRKHLVATL
ncbi:hypothetical protein AKJ09_04649 [Labilithrix luteola]|uniref:Uncharacterized protein n=1 Tax=Labilithrix luteola TaxID=1391654 RepID=A0A0K1PWS6_9BACT|nr:hypothetical protein AKJ09_04649 [Labilithrix luteola]